jgi:hypothetical protein
MINNRLNKGIYYLKMESPDSKRVSEVELLKSYLESLSEKERKAYEIAKDHLGMSFQLEKSSGYNKWKKDLQK